MLCPLRWQFHHQVHWSRSTRAERKDLPYITPTAESRLIHNRSSYQKLAATRIRFDNLVCSCYQLSNVLFTAKEICVYYGDANPEPDHEYRTMATLRLVVRCRHRYELRWWSSTRCHGKCLSCHEPMTSFASQPREHTCWWFLWANSQSHQPFTTWEGQPTLFKSQCLYHYS